MNFRELISEVETDDKKNSHSLSYEGSGPFEKQLLMSSSSIPYFSLGGIGLSGNCKSGFQS